MRKGRRALVIAAAALAVLAVALFVKRDLVRMVFYSNYDPKNPLKTEGEWSGGTARTGVRYAEISESDYLNLYVPDGVDRPPLIVAIHGGGFVLNDCESRQAQLFYRYFRDHGYAVATVNYRLAGEASFPAAVQDVKCAIRFLRANADAYGYDASKIAVWGESAGGYLAVMAAVTSEEEFNDLPFIGEDALEAPVSSRVDALLDYYGAVRLESRAERNAAFATLGVPALVVDIANGWLKDAIRDMPWAESCEDAWMGRPFSELTEAERQAASPLWYAQKNLNADSGLEVLILHGDADITVPVTQSRQLYELLSERLGPEHVLLRIVRNAGHADEDMYSDTCLGTIGEWLDAKL